MQSRSLPGGTACGPLGFGCGAVMGRVGRKDSLRAMHAALDSGVTLFDTARSYGYGESEAVLGEFLQGRREQVLLSTKFGTEPARRQRWKQMLRPVARAVLRQIPSARQAVRRGAGSQPAASPITVQTLYSSLEQSLRQLRTDHVDFFFLHDVPPSAVAQDGIFSALVQLRDQGKIRWFGVSSSLETAAAACQQRPEAIAAQLPVNLDNLARANEVAQRNLANPGRILLANNIFGGVDGAHASQQTLQKLAQDRILPGGLREKLTQLNGTAASSLMASVMLPIVLRTIRANVAIVSMMSPQRVQANVEAVEHDPWTEEELTLLYARLTGTVEDLASTA